MTLEDSQAEVVVEDNMTESFIVIVRVSQDHSLSVILFN